MRRLLVRLGRVALVVPVLVALAGCDIAMADLKVKETAEWRKTYPLQEGGRIEINNVNGRIQVEPSGSNSVEVVAVKSARGSTAERAKESLGRVEITDAASPNSIRIDTKIQRGSGMFNHGGVEVAYTVRVPGGADMKFTTVNGGIEVSRINGRIAVETVNGGIVARDVEGGSLAARTVNGGVEVDLSRMPESGVTLGCTNGGIRLRLPADSKADISARVVNGGIDVDAEALTISTSEKSRRRFEGKMNGGGARIDIEGTNGGIEIARR
jgi:hypothetical protein